MTAARVVAPLLTLMAALYLALGFGLRYGELVWSGHHVGRLPAEQRWWSVAYGVLLLGSAAVILELAGVLSLGALEPSWLTSAGFATTTLLGVATIAAVVGGSKWERWLFSLVTLAGALLAGWLTFG